MSCWNRYVPDHGCTSVTTGWSGGTLLLLLLLLQLMRDTIQAIGEARSRAQLLHVVAIDMAPSKLRSLGVSSVTNCFTDPCSWVQSCSSHSLVGSHQGHGSSSGAELWHDLQMMQQLWQSGLASMLGQTGGSCCLVIAGLSTLLLRHSDTEVRLRLQQADELRQLHVLECRFHIAACMRFLSSCSTDPGCIADMLLDALTHSQ